MYYCVYQITNKLNGNIYIGSHRTKNLADDYMGSGALIKRAVQKYGKQNFVKEYLHIFDNAGEMLKMEADLVNTDFIRRRDTYNQCEGGTGGNLSEWNKKHNKYKWENSDYKEKMLGVLKTNRENLIKRLLEDHSFNEQYRARCKGKRHTEESKRKIGQKNSIHQTGINNVNYGKIWITNKWEEKLINKTDPIADGWVRGRINFRKSFSPRKI